MIKSLNNTTSVSVLAVANTPVTGQSAVNTAEPICNTLYSVYA